MKYLLSLSLIALLLVSCAKETIEQESSADLSAQISSDNLNYKGIFTTLDSKHRATVTIEIPTNSNTVKGIQPKAVITFSNGKTVEAFAGNTISKNKAVENLTFKGNNLSFNFSSTASGEDAIISDAVYNSVATSIKISQVRLGDPLPVTYLGTYECTDCGTHPVLGTGVTQTFNVMIANGGFGATTDVTTQIILGSTDFGSTTGNEQMDCEGVEDSATSCPISGASFNDLITWEGNHYIDFAVGCEGVTGTWEYDSPNNGILNGTFISDNSCTVTLLDLDFTGYNGAGFSPMPSAGQLDSNLIIANGFSGSLAYGDTSPISGDYARGFNDGGTATGGLYNFEFDAGNPTFGIHPGGSDFTPGTVDLRIENTSGKTLTSFDISYLVYVNNDQGRGNSLNFSYSTDNMTFTDVTALDLTSADAADGLGFVSNEKMTSISATVLDGEYLYIRFSGNDETGSGSRDEFAIDDILVTGI